MSTKKQHLTICDVCGRQVATTDEILLGGHPLNGWFHIQRHGGSTDLKALQEQRKWPKDVCSLDCLRKLAELQGPSSAARSLA